MGWSRHLKYKKQISVKNATVVIKAQKHLKSPILKKQLAGGYLFY